MCADHEKPWYLPSLEAFLLEDCPRELGISPQLFHRDVLTLTARLATEGESFVTKTLPSFAKSVDLALQGHVPLVSLHFRKCGKTSRPSFLKALTRNVFTEDGWVKDNPCIVSIRLLRQVSCWYKKLKKGYTDESLHDATTQFIDVDSSLPDLDHNFISGNTGTARAVIKSILYNMPPITAEPKHGPGAVSNYSDTVAKRRLEVKYADLESVFRPIPWMRSCRDTVEDLDSFFNRKTFDYGLSSMRFVPKDSEGPRIIGLEPAEYMWCQQAVKNQLYHHIETRSVAKGQINFTSQETNRGLTLNWQRWITLDMSKASDRNSYALVRQLFEGLSIWRYLRASRTPGIVLPDGTVHFYKKFAPMGSALCFPIEALVFYALAVSVLHARGVPLVLALKQVYVYGDDLIVPVGYYDDLKECFEFHHLKFNDGKCCTHGKFRESCGLDAYDGEVVTPIRGKNILPNVKSPNKSADLEFDPSALVSTIEHANNLMRAGYRSSAVALREQALKISELMRSLQIPVNPRDDLPFLSWYDPESPDKLRYKTCNSITKVRGWGTQSRKIESNPDDEKRYLRESLSRGGPVGILIKDKKSTEVPGGWVQKRVFEKPFDLILRKKNFVVLEHEPDGTPSQEGVRRVPCRPHVRGSAWYSYHVTAA